MLVFDDNVQIRQVGDLGQVAANQQYSAKCVAISHAGEMIAIASSEGQIDIIFVNSVQPRSNKIQLDGQSDSITDLAFSRDGKRLVAIGKPNRIKKAAKLEHEVMVWELSANEWTQLGQTEFQGQQFNPTVTRFSDNGNRILAFNDTGNQDDWQTIVLGFQTASKESEPFFRLESQSKDRFNDSVFADAEGRTVVSSISDVTQNEHGIVVWSTDEPGIYVAESKQLADSRITKLDLHNNAFLAVTENRRLLFWNKTDKDFSFLNRKPPSIFRGHKNSIEIAGILDSPDKLISASFEESKSPEILISDTSKFAQEQVRFGPNVGDNPSVPVAFFENRDATNRVAMGNDHGLVSIHDKLPFRLTGDTESETVSERSACQWEVDAWEKHIITNDYLFALSKRDNLYRYDLKTGTLQAVLTQMRQGGKISQLEISRDSRYAVLQRKEKKFEIWDLHDVSLVKTVTVGQGDFGAFNENLIPNLQISPDGKWIAAGKVSVFVWRTDGTPVGRMGNETKLESRLNSIRFFSGADKLAISYGDRIKLYNLGSSLESTGTYSVKRLPGAANFPNLVDATALIDGNQYLLVRRLVKSEKGNDLGMDLLQLNSNGKANKVQQFLGANEGAFFGDKALLVTADEKRAVVVFDIPSGQKQPQEVSVKLPDSLISGSRVARTKFSRVYMNSAGELVVNWRFGSKNNTVSIRQNSLLGGGSKLGELVVVAEPIVESVGLTPERAISFANTKLRLWRFKENDNRSVSPESTVEGNFRMAEISPDGTRAFVIGLSPPSTAILSLGSNIQREEISGIDPAKVGSVAWSNDGNQLAVGSMQGKVQILNAENFSMAVTVDLEESADPGKPEIQQLKFADDGKSLVVVQSGQTSVLKEDNAWQVSVTLKHPDNDPIECADIASDGNRVITGSDRGRITLWDTEVLEKPLIEKTEEVSLPLVDVQPDEPESIEGRALLTLGRLRSAIHDVNFTSDESGVIAFETNSESAIYYPATKK